ncbi:bridging integrator 2a [Salarias fasciatus]|uniref:bridging integrator 2a n=1 Tax=Salarias fasciatus TaxID=181472 RepID=UPI001176CA35|nr:bridging integrator 2-like [Salarias fasciatus]
MSDSPKGNSSDFAKKVQRQLSRSKEKVLQKLGKTAETRDDQFEQCLQQFNDQSSDGNRIYKDLRGYINAVRDMREASRRLFQSLFDVYESNWMGEEDLGAIVEGEDLLWNDYEVKLLDQAVRTMESYVAQFPDIKDKIAKRGRKLVDYDSSRHHLEALQAAKKRDDIKIQKAKEEENNAKSVYEGINTELKEELPVLYESRIGCYVSVFSAMSNLRDIFYKEMSTFNLDLQNVIKELQAQHPDKVFAVRGLQRYGSLKRRSLMSPKAWKASFSDFHWNYSPRPTLRSSFRSPDKPRHSTLSRESGSFSGSSQSVPIENLIPESRDVEAEPSQSEIESSAQQEGASAETSGDKPEEDSSQTEKDEALKEPPAEPGSQEGSKKAPPSDSSSELNNSCDSESLNLSGADNGPLHIEEEEEDGDDPESPDLTKPSRQGNGDVSVLSSDDKDSSPPHKDTSEVDSKSTDV